MKFETQKHMGRNQLVDRLTSQVGSRSLAIGLLIKRGDLKPDGKTFTAQGAKKNAMTASERAIARAKKVSGRDASDYEYNKQTNRATLKHF
jgi:hypothetical protein